eukprot:603510-Pleurochrysis_carterae.AAC.1
MGHHAMLRASPLSAGFSMAHTVPTSCAVCASLAVNSARLLCFAVQRAHSAGMGCTPFGCARVRSWGACATEKEAHGGAAKTMRYRPCATHPSTRPATSGTVTSWSLPPAAMLIAYTSSPRARSSLASVDRALPSPTNTIRARAVV